MLSIHASLVEGFRQTLLADGFTSAGIFQIWKHGQVFGYIRRLRHDLEWHVRAYADGRLESELEPPRNTIRHLLVNPYQSDGMLALLLSQHQIPFSTPQ
jgi:hypothetical protein